MKNLTPPQPLTIEQTEYTLDAIDNRSTTLSFTASAAWTLSVTGEDSDWLTVTPAIGTAGSKSVTLTAAPRITEESRRLMWTSPAERRPCR